MTLQIDSNFPGGNIVVESIDGDTVRLHQDLRDTAGDWFSWCFRVRGGGGRTVRFEFTKSRAIGVRGPAVSGDGGLTWRWLGMDHVEGNTFSCAIPSDAPEVRLSFGIPYLESDWRRFVSGLAGNPYVSGHTLCTTPKGREAEYALVGCLDAEPAHRVAITCRHHCCEAMADYSLEGMIRWIAEDGIRGLARGGSLPRACPRIPEAQWLRENVQFLIVPFVDKDGVEDGDQGKNRRPRDHGRDYQGESLYATTAAIRDLVPRWSAGRLRLGMDLHCPWIDGVHNEVIYVVGSALANVAVEQERFSRVLASVTRGPLPFDHSEFLPYGVDWNANLNFTDGKSFSRWLGEQPEPVPCMSMEIPYANASGAEVNPTSARLFGEDLGRAVAAYLRGMGTA